MDNNYSLMDIAAVAGGNTGFGGNNNIVTLLLLFALCGNGNGFFGNNRSEDTLERAIDLNSIQNGQRDIAADVQRTAYEQIGATKDAAYNNLSEIRDLESAVTTGNSNILNNLTAMQAIMQNCCCETKQAIMENRYLDAQNTAVINSNTTAQVQKILDALAQNKIDALQAQVSELKTQNMFCGIPRINPYGYGVYAYEQNRQCCGGGF